MKTGTSQKLRISTPTVEVGSVKIGGGHQVVIQSMTNTDTADVASTVEQCIALADAGSEIVRITVNNEASAKAVPAIRSQLNAQGYSHLPLVGDFHYNGHELLTKFPDCARALDKYRINPGNVGFGDSRDENFETFIEIAVENNKPVRIGVNWGSIDQRLLTQMMDENSKLTEPLSDREVMIETMVKSALDSARYARDLGLREDQIVLSVKMSNVQDVIAAYRLLAKKMQADSTSYALHLGLTEAGSGLQGVTSSSAALAILLQEGLGDTIRISLTPAPGSPRTEEVEACKALLQALDLRHFTPKVTSCPGCGRTDSTFFQELAAQVTTHIAQKMPQWKAAYPEQASKIAQLKIAVMGCVVNGPGESKHSDIAISLPGRSEANVAPVFIGGKFAKNLTGDDIPAQFIGLLDNYISLHFGPQ